MQSHAPLYTTWEGCRIFSFVIQKELYFLCLPGNEEFALAVREGVDTLQDIFEQRSHCMTDRTTAENLSGRGKGWVGGYSSQMTIRISAALWGVVFRPVWPEMGHTFCLISLKRGTFV